MLVKLWINSYGEDNARGILENLSGRPNIYARVNTLKTNTDELISALADDKVKAEKVDFPSNAVKIADTGSIERLKAYKGGLLHIQDLSSQLCAYFLSAEKDRPCLTFALPLEEKPLPQPNICTTAAKLLPAICTSIS